IADCASSRRVCLMRLLRRSTQSRKSGGPNDWLAGTRDALHSTKKLFQGFLQAVRQRQTYVLHVRWADLNLIQQPAHTPRLLGAEQMALARTPAHHFSGRRDLKTLGGSAVRLRLHFRVLLHDFLFCFTASRFNSLRSREVNAVHAISNLQTFQLLLHFCKNPKLSYACASGAFCAAGVEAAPFFGASNASRIFASMRGPNSTC